MCRRCDRRQYRLVEGGQFPGDELAFDLEADEEEEDRHQPIIDPQVQGLGDRAAADIEAELGLPQAVVLVLEPGIGDYERD